MELADQRIVVMGLGRFGGGVGVTRYLCRQGADVLVTDQAPPETLAGSVAALGDLVDGGQVTLRLGEHNVSDFTTADLVVVNPAVDPRDNRFLRAAAAADVPTTSEIRLLIEALPASLRDRTIGVTGSAGKSTVTAMIGHILATASPPPSLHGVPPPNPIRVHVGGNLGGSLLDNIDRIRPHDWLVLELSSFMLEDLDHDQWSPHVAVVTNLRPNHLDRHGDYDAYVAAKQTILEHQQPRDRCVLGPGVASQMRPMAPQVFVRSSSGVTAGGGPVPINLLLPGAHNQDNARLAVAAAAACDIPGLTPAAAAAALDDFTGLPHRLQLVVEHAGVRYFNDSKSTTPEAAVLAIHAFEPGRVHVILGGYDKKSDLSELATAAAGHCRAVYTMGRTGEPLAEKIEAAAAAADDSCASHGRRNHASPPTEVVRCHTLSTAVTESASRLVRGDVLLLSPGCASWDQFDNYERRGEAFVAAVLAATTETALVPPGSEVSQQQNPGRGR